MHKQYLLNMDVLVLHRMFKLTSRAQRQHHRVPVQKASSSPLRDLHRATTVKQTLMVALLSKPRSKML
jgi:RNA polymerase-interacting CarD/CdnL/TRCF family regulator